MLFKQYIHAEKKGNGSTVFSTESFDNPSCDSKGENKHNRACNFPKDKLATFGYIQVEIIKILGKILTDIDASIIEERQNKALKDIIKNDFYNELAFIGNQLLDQAAMQKLADKHFEGMSEDEIELHSVTSDEVFGIEA